MTAASLYGTGPLKTAHDPLNVLGREVYGGIGGVERDGMGRSWRATQNAMVLCDGGPRLEACERAVDLEGARRRCRCERGEESSDGPKNHRPRLTASVWAVVFAVGAAVRGLRQLLGTAAGRL